MYCSRRGRQDDEPGSRPRSPVRAAVLQHQFALLFRTRRVWTLLLALTGIALWFEYDHQARLKFYEEMRQQRTQTVDPQSRGGTPLGARLVYTDESGRVIAVETQLAQGRDAAGRLLIAPLQRDPAPAIVGAAEILYLVGVGWALLVWWHEFRNRRNYHWAMPVSRVCHDLARTAAGAGWLLLGGAVFCMVAIVAAYLGGVTAPAPTAVLPAVFWISCFALLLIPYLALTFLILLTARPLEWLIGLPAGILIVAFVLDGLGIVNNLRPQVVSLLEPLWPIGLSLQYAIDGGRSWAVFAWRNAVLPDNGWGPPLFSAAETSVTMLLWTCLAGMLVLMAARRRPS